MKSVFSGCSLTIQTNLPLSSSYKLGVLRHAETSTARFISNPQSPPNTTFLRPHTLFNSDAKKRKDARIACIDLNLSPTGTSRKIEFRARIARTNKLERHREEGSCTVVVAEETVNVDPRRRINHPPSEASYLN